MRSPDGLRGTHHTNEAGRALTELGAVAYAAVQHCPVSSLCPLGLAYRQLSIGQTPRYLLTSCDVEERTLDLVSSSFVHTNAIQTIAMASKGWYFFLLHPLLVEVVFF